MIIGVTGPICGGSDTVGKILVEKGFERLSLSDELRRRMKEEGIEINRKNMQDYGDMMREKYGLGVLAKMMLEKLDREKDYVIESIRNPAEIEEFRKMKEFYLLMVDSPAEMRFKRLLERGRDNDEPKTYLEFLEWEKRDLGIGQPVHGQQQGKCFDLADGILLNDCDLPELKEKIENLVLILKKKIASIV